MREDDLLSVDSILSDLWSRLDYGVLAEPDTPTQLLVAASFTRTTAVRLATALQEKGMTGETISNWVDCRLDDPLPEVRHALQLR